MTSSFCNTPTHFQVPRGSLQQHVWEQLGYANNGNDEEIHNASNSSPIHCFQSDLSHHTTIHTIFKRPKDLFRWEPKAFQAKVEAYSAYSGARPLKVNWHKHSTFISHVQLATKHHFVLASALPFQMIHPYVAGCSVTFKQNSSAYNQISELLLIIGTQTYLERLLITPFPEFRTDASAPLCLCAIPISISCRIQASREGNTFRRPLINWPPLSTVDKATF